MENVTVLEAASWKLAGLLVRRHPNLTVRRIHPGGGSYNVLAVHDASVIHGPRAMLNRHGTVQVDQAVNPVEWPAMSWSEVLRRGAVSIIEDLESATG